MDIWIIQDGEKTGPIHDFEIRRRIEAGELPPTTPAWHEGLGMWTPLVEIGIFQREFDKPAPPETPASSPEPAPERVVPPPLPDQPHLIRRFWARWLDLYLYAGVWWIAMWAAGRDIGMILQHQWIILFHYVPWFVLETFLLHRFGTTPGKWLLGIKVVNHDGSLLSLAEATRRCARVLFIGIGFGWGILALICQLMSLITTKRLGRPLWDQAGGHRLEVSPFDPFRIAGYVFVLFVSIQLQMIVVAPYVMETAGKVFPDLQEQLEKNPPWHLPKRH
mgnify:CR=1 FL=1